MDWRFWKWAVWMQLLRALFAAVEEIVSDEDNNEETVDGTVRFNVTLPEADYLDLKFYARSRRMPLNQLIIDSLKRATPQNIGALRDGQETRDDVRNQLEALAEGRDAAEDRGEIVGTDVEIPEAGVPAVPQQVLPVLETVLPPEVQVSEDIRAATPPAERPRYVPHSCFNCVPGRARGQHSVGHGTCNAQENRGASCGYPSGTAPQCPLYTANGAMPGQPASRAEPGHRPSGAYDQRGSGGGGFNGTGF